MKKINGSIAAPFTPMHADGSINYDRIDTYADFLVRNQLDGAFICGSSGEGALLTIEERKKIARALVDCLKWTIKGDCAHGWNMPGRSESIG